MSTGRQGRRQRWTTAVGGTVAVAIFLCAAGPPVIARTPAAGSLDPPAVRVIVMGRTEGGDVARAVDAAGGRVTRLLPIVHGMAATVPAASLHPLSQQRSVLSVTPDRPVHVQGGAAPDASNASVYAKAVGADRMARQGSTGSGVTVAVIDTGIAPVPDVASRLVPVTDDVTGDVTACKNFSGEAGCDDGFGHGTFMAGIIAGDGASSGGLWTGVAPGAHLLSVKVAGRTGSSDVSAVLAALQWAVSFRERYGIDVINLSLGTDSTQSYRVDPLNYAVERAWDAGITVVVSASNRGPEAGTISKPGDDPLVITVGATDDRGTPATADDRLPHFSGRGPTAEGLAKPDVTAPGALIVSLRAPGSAIDQAVPTAFHPAYRRGSGTSMSTAVVSGAVALLLQARPGTVPDRVKFALISTARRVASDDPLAVGAGSVDADRATHDAPGGTANAGVQRSNGSGTLDASRGTVHVETTDPFAVVLDGAMTAQLAMWAPSQFLGLDWNAAGWALTTFSGNNWHGNNWHGNDWHGNNWHGASFYGDDDPGASYGTPAAGSAWFGAWEL